MKKKNVKANLRSEERKEKQWQYNRWTRWHKDFLPAWT